MKIKKFIICFCLFLVLFITGCKKDDENINKDFIFENASYAYDYLFVNNESSSYVSFDVNLKN